MVSTVSASASAINRAADTVYAAATHALLSGLASERLSSVPLDELVVTNTIHIPESRRFEQLTVLSVAGLLANAIQFIHSNESVSQLFEITDEKREPGEAPAAD